MIPPVVTVVCRERAHELFSSPRWRLAIVPVKLLAERGQQLVMDRKRSSRPGSTSSIQPSNWCCVGRVSGPSCMTNARRITTSA
jgi:hypothetical protein